MVSSAVTPQKRKKKLRPNRYLTELSSQSLVSFLVQALNVVTLYWKFIKEGMVDKPMVEHLVYFHKAWIFWTFFHCLWSSKRYITHPLGTPHRWKLLKKDNKWGKYEVSKQDGPIFIDGCVKTICDLELKIFEHYSSVLEVQKSFI
jgi:hypothetical protein